MDQTNLPQKSHQRSPHAADDIPEALRDPPEPVSPPPKVTPPSRLPVLLISGGVMGLLTIATLGIWLLPPLLSGERSPMIAQSNDSASPTTLASSPEPTDPKLLGHFPYPEAPPSELVPIVADGSLKLRKAAAQAFQQMVAAAQAEEVALVPISGFRSQADQNYLFFNVKAQRGQTASKRAEVSAPPGYSEHHTGYAVDIGDRTVPALNLNPDFEKTKAFQWLQSNAARFSFELSFPQGNAPGVTYEPWHWRFVGDRQSLETFYKARSGVKPKP